MDYNHNFIDWWREKSRWYDENTPFELQFMAEGKLAVDAWNSALDEVLKESRLYELTLEQIIDKLKFQPS